MGQVITDVCINDGNNCCTNIEYTDTHDPHQQDLPFNSRRYVNECQPNNNLNVHSLDSLVPPIFMTEENDIRGQLDALNLMLSPPSINLEEAYDFASLLFSPPQITIAQSE